MKKVGINGWDVAGGVGGRKVGKRTSKTGGWTLGGWLVAGLVGGRAAVLRRAFEGRANVVVSGRRLGDQALPDSNFSVGMALTSTLNGGFQSS